MARRKQCSSCLFFISITEVPSGVRKVSSMYYDGWCMHYGEERGKTEDTCKHYCKQLNRREPMDDDIQ